MVNSDMQTNGSTVVMPSPSATPTTNGKAIECIDLDSDDDVLIEDEPPVKRSKSSTPMPSSNKAKNMVCSPPPISTIYKLLLLQALVTDDTPQTQATPIDSKSLAKKDSEKLSDYTTLLDRLVEHIDNTLSIKANVDRKLLDTLLGAINIQVQKEPYAVRKLILDKQLVLPNSISFPPSQVTHDFSYHPRPPLF